MLFSLNHSLVFLFLYLWYSHTISFSNVCVGGTSPCELDHDLLYCCHKHFIRVVGMVMRCLPVFSYIWVFSFSVCIVSLWVMIYFSGLHSVMNICVRRIYEAGRMNRVSLFCSSKKCVLVIVL